MAFSHSLARRVRELFGRRRGVTERQMFGGLAFLLHGHMCVGVWQDSLIARLGVEQAAIALIQPHVQEFDVTGRPLKGWVVVAPNGLENDAQLAAWIENAIEFVSRLPPKKVSPR